MYVCLHVMWGVLQLVTSVSVVSAGQSACYVVAVVVDRARRLAAKVLMDSASPHVLFSLSLSLSIPLSLSPAAVADNDTHSITHSCCCPVTNAPHKHKHTNTHAAGLLTPPGVV